MVRELTSPVRIGIFLVRAVTITAVVATARPLPALAQGRLGGGTYGPWSGTAWSFIELRVKCDGALPFSGGSPTSWRVQLRNKAKDPVSADVTASVAGMPGKGVTRRVTLKANVMKETQVELSTDCAGAVQMALDNVRLGDDKAETPYVKPDKPSD